jgi:hypothetical protein
MKDEHGRQDLAPAVGAALALALILAVALIIA